MQILTPKEKRLLRRVLRAKKAGRVQIPDANEAYRRFLVEYERCKAAGRFPDPEATDAVVYGKRSETSQKPEDRSAPGVIGILSNQRRVD
jgi:hypothetical protein